MDREIVEVKDMESQNNNGSHSQVKTCTQAIFTKTNHSITLTFNEIYYKIKPKKQRSMGKKNKIKTDDKIILKGINGVVYPGELLAMLGPSGSGKTTLITALGGRLGGRLTGRITYNGKPFTNAVKRNTGFVTQDDVFLPNLTVTETLVFTALLRLPNTLTTQEKTSHAEALITQLGLVKCKNSIVGGPRIRGISGGEKKRVSIGQELLINPSLLFLDEPTSGLDSTTAQRIVSTLWDLANGGRTIVMTIHQPSSRLFYMFHKIMLLSEGNVIYFGKGSEAMDYFSSIGYSPSVLMNPSDYMLDLANGSVISDLNEEAGVIKEKLVSCYKSKIDEKLKLEIKGIDEKWSRDDENRSLSSEDKKFGRWPITWWQQFSVLLRRGIKERRHESFSTIRVCQILTVSFLCGLVWWQSHISHLQDQLGLLFFQSSFWAFFPLMQAIFTFPKERETLKKERASGMYKLSSYFMSRIVGDLPMELVLPTVFTIITYWMAGLKRNAVNFFATLFSLLLSVMVSQGFGLAIGAMVMDQRKATTLGSVIMLSFMLVGGYYVHNVPEFIAWIKYLSIGLYSYKLLLISQYKDSDTYPCNNGGVCSVSEFPSIRHVGLDGRVESIVAMVLMLIGYRLLAYFSLMRIGIAKKPA